MKKTTRSILSMLMIVMMIVMLLSPAFAEKGGKKPPPTGDPTKAIVTLESEIPSTVAYGETIEFVLKASSKDGDQNNWSVIGSNATVIAQSSIVKKTTIKTTFTYVNNNAGLDEFTISYNGTKQGSIDLIIDINLEPEINNAPMLTEVNYNFDVVEDMVTLLDISASDEDIESLVYTAIGELVYGSVEITGGNISYIPTHNLNGTDSFTIKVTDDMNQTDTASVTVTVMPDNDAPYFEESIYHLTVEQESFILIDQNAIDVDLIDELNYSIDAASIQGSLDTTSYPFIYYPKLGFVGIDSFDLIATDLAGLDDTTTISILVTEINIAPEFINFPYSITIDEDTTGLVTLEAYDDNAGDTLVYSLESTTTLGVAIIDGDTISYTPNENSNDTVTLDVSVTDGNLTDTTTVTFIITPVNDAPTIEGNYDFTIENNSTHTFNIIASDVDLDLLTYSMVETDQAVLEGTTVTYTPDGTLSTDIIQVAVSDGKTTTTMYVYVTIIDDEIVYVALGDSVPYGTYYTSFWNYLFGGTDTYSYVEQFADYLNVTSNYDYSESGDHTFEVLEDLNGHLADEVINADVITLCVGANDVMDALPRTSSGLGKDNIDWDIANSGLENFKTNWPLVIDKIYELNSDVTLIVMTVYNPYRTSESYYNQVNTYFEGSDGMNTIIRTSEDNYPDQFNYLVADVYHSFDNNTYFDPSTNRIMEKDELTGFYNNFCDPHPNQYGQNLIFDVHMKAYQPTQ